MNKPFKVLIIGSDDLMIIEAFESAFNTGITSFNTTKIATTIKLPIRNTVQEFIPIITKCYTDPSLNETHKGKWFDNIKSNKIRNKHWR